MEYVARKLQHNLDSTAMHEHKAFTSTKRASHTAKTNTINITVTQKPRELEAPPTSTLPLVLPEVKPDSASSIYSHKTSTSSTRRSFKNFLSRPKKSNDAQVSSSNDTSRATSTASKRSTREFMSSMSAYPWVTGAPGYSNERLTSSTAGSTRSTESRKRGSEKQRKDSVPWAFPSLAGCC